MKHLLLLTVFTLLFACKGEIGPKGDKGDTGATGTTGATGATGTPGKDGEDGQNAAQPTVYDFTIDLSKALPMWDFPNSKELGNNEVVLAYIMTNKGTGYSPLPYRGYAYTSDQQNFVKLDATFSIYKYFLSFDNETSVPPGASFWIRAVFIKGTQGSGRVSAIDLERYQNYENLKADFNLPD